jgi:hypothetical protein
MRGSYLVISRCGVNLSWLISHSILPSRYTYLIICGDYAAEMDRKTHSSPVDWISKASDKISWESSGNGTYHESRTLSLR